MQVTGHLSGGVSSSLPHSLGIPGLELKWPGLGSKCFYTLGHLPHLENMYCPFFQGMVSVCVCVIP